MEVLDLTILLLGLASLFVWQAVKMALTHEWSLALQALVIACANVAIAILIGYVIYQVAKN